MHTTDDNVTATLTLMGLQFQHVITPTTVDGSDPRGPIVRYRALVDTRQSQRGVYVVTVNGSAVYVGKYARTLAKRWLYTRQNYIYHHTRHRIAELLAGKHDVRVYVADEQDLVRQISMGAQTSSPWINTDGIERALIYTLKPAWNVLQA